MDQTGHAIVETVQDVAVLTLRRPPSNALSSGFCQHIAALIAQVMAAGDHCGLVIASSLPVFSAGFDVAEMLVPQPRGRADFAALCAAIARAQKPVVAAVAGPCLSTGFDLALAAQARVAGPRASFGFPDLRLGLLPAGGGGFRLARLVGAKLAIDMLLTSDAVPQAEALEMGLADRAVAAGGEVAGAVQLARALAQNGQAVLAPARRDYAANLRADMAAVTEARRALPAQRTPWIAQHRALDIVEASLLLPEPMALDQEAATYAEVQRGPIARALCYAFVARQRAQNDRARAKENGTPVPDHKAIEGALRRIMGQIVAHFERLGLARRDVLAALAAFGIAAPAGQDLPPCPPGAQDVAPALLAALANAGAGMVRRGEALRADVIDDAALGAGMFPNWRGGPMYDAALHGAVHMRDQLRRRASAAKGAGPDAEALFTPDPLWDILIAEDTRLEDYMP